MRLGVNFADLLVAKRYKFDSRWREGAAKIFHSATKQLVADNDSDSDEEGGIIQSEFGTSLQMEKSARAKPSKKETNGEAVQSSDEDEDEDMDLSAAIKRKFK